MGEGIEVFHNGRRVDRLEASAPALLFLLDEPLEVGDRVAIEAEVETIEYREPQQRLVRRHVLRAVRIVDG